MAFVKIILLPLSVIYGVVTGVRNFLFHIGILKSQTFRIPVICVGNITVGGTGKTPHTELIISELKKKFRVACLSRDINARPEALSWPTNILPPLKSETNRCRSKVNTRIFW